MRGKFRSNIFPTARILLGAWHGKTWSASIESGPIFFRFAKTPHVLPALMLLIFRRSASFGRTKTALFYSLLFFALTNSGFGQTDNFNKPEFGPAPEWVVDTPWNAPEKLVENTSGEDFLLVDEQTRVASNENYHHRIYQIVSDSGRQSGSQVYFYFDPSYQKLMIHQIRLIRGVEIFDRLNPEKIQVLQQERDLDSQLYNGQRSALLILDDVRVGDIIDIGYTLKGANPVFDGKFIDSTYVDWSVPVRDWHYRLLVPNGRTVHSRSLGSSRALFSSKALKDEQELDWKRNNGPIIESDDRVPASHILYSYVDLSEFSSWREVVEWAVPLYASEIADHPLLQSAKDEIEKFHSSPDQKAVAALNFVQQQIRYLGIEMGPGSHRPSEPEEVLRRRFGDCKDKARLLTTLLKSLGFEAAPALVHSSRREAVRERLPTPYAFDHVVVALDLNSRRYILDPTLTYQRGATLELRHVGRYGPYLRLDSANDKLENAKLGPFDLGHTVFKETFQVPAVEGKPSTLTVVTVAEGRAADSQRSRFATRTLDQIGREYLDYYTHYYPGISQSKIITTSDNPPENIYTTTEYYEIKNLFSTDSENKILRAEFQPASIWDYLRTPNLSQRVLPLSLNHPTRIEQQITVNLPETWNVTPYEETVSDSAFTLEARIKNLSPQVVYMGYVWESKTHSVAPQRVSDFADNTRKARKALGYQLTWTRPKKDAPVSTETISAASDDFPLNWPMVALASGAVLAGTFPSWRIIKKKNPIPSEPPVMGASSSSSSYDYSVKPAANLEGLGGWLIPVAFGLIVRPISVLKVLYDSGRAYFNNSVWQVLTNPSDASYNAGYSLVAPMELTYNITVLIFCILLLVLFFRRSYLFPRTMQVFLGFTVCGAFFVLWDNATLHQDTKESYKLIAQSLGGAAIWIPYFQVSRRVKLTFTK